MVPGNMQGLDWHPQLLLHNPRNCPAAPAGTAMNHEAPNSEQVRGGYPETTPQQSTTNSDPFFEGKSLQNDVRSLVYLLEVQAFMGIVSVLSHAAPCTISKPGSQSMPMFFTAAWEEEIYDQKLGS